MSPPPTRVPRFRGPMIAPSFSSKDPTLYDHVVKPDLVAPGNRVLSLSSLSTVFMMHPENFVHTGCLL